MAEPVSRGSRRSRRPSEREAIDLLERLLTPAGYPPAPVRAGGRIQVGIGDDAAVLRRGKQPLVWSVDVCVEGVHFDRRWLSLEDVGWRSLSAALSDLAAMGATPVAALSSLIVPRSVKRAELRSLGRGQAEASRELCCPVVGGNISRGERLSVTTTVLGECARALLRSGAHPGHALWLVGDVGLAAAGQRLLSARRRARRPAAAAERACIAAWRRPRALLEFGRRLGGRASSVIDVSDGVARDAWHLARGSGVRIVIEEKLLSAVLRRELLEVGTRLGVSPLELALYGGEDYALLATGETRRKPRFARRLGRVVRGRGVVLLRRDGRTERVADRGFDHLAGP